jgi:two-component system, chemotaxis family, protein-glutamate methylesterase/glutaminase
MNAVLASGRSLMSLEPVIRVLIVDDSAVAREVLTTILRRDGFEVATASSAEVASAKIAQSRPDVVLLDLQLPGRSGLEFLEQQMKSDPLPVVVCSGIAQTGTSAAIRALELGALDVLPKPALGIRALLGSGDIALDAVIRAAAAARPRFARSTTPLRRVEETRSRPVLMELAPSRKVIVIGASTGGTEAIRTILSKLPADAPPVVIVQHMPGAFTPMFAQRMNAFASMEVREARDGDVVQTGVALIAPGGRHLDLLPNGGTPRVRVYDGPLVSRHRPSVDVLFASAARTLGPRAIGVLLTGMGADGADGMVAMRAHGGHTIAQDEASCVVYGMPREAMLRGGAVQSLPLDHIAAGIMKATKDSPHPT